MSPPSFHNKVRRWLAGRWYRLLFVIAAGFVLGVPVASAFLFGLAYSDQSILLGGLAGLACAFFYSFIHVATSITGAMRCPTSIRAAIAIVIPVTAVALLEYVPVNLEFRSIPIILTYCICFGSTVTGIAFRDWLDEELVGKGSRVLTRSPRWTDKTLIIGLMIFFGGQYVSLGGGWYGTMTSPGVLFWSLVLSAASAWGFAALSRFRQRRSAYSIAVPVSVVAMFMLYLQFRRDTDALLPWSGFLAFAAAAPVGWCLSQEVSSRALTACGWKWRRTRKRPKSTLASRARIMEAERSWRTLAALFLVAATFATVYVLAGRTYVDQAFGLHAILSALFLGVGWACLGSFSVLAAHQNRHLLLQSLLTAGAGVSITAISTRKLPYYPETNVMINNLLPLIPMAIFVHLAVRILDRSSRLTIGISPAKRKQVGIDDLMMLTLLLGCGFAMMRFADVWMVTFSMVMLVSLSTVTLLIFRIYFIGPSYQSLFFASALIAVLAFFCIRYWDSLMREIVIGSFVFVAADIAIVRWLARQGWRKMELCFASKGV